MIRGKGGAGVLGSGKVYIVNHYTSEVVREGEGVTQGLVNCLKLSGCFYTNITHNNLKV